MIQQLTQKLQTTNNLATKERQLTIHHMDALIARLVDTITKICTSPPLPVLIDCTSKQGGVLPMKLQQIWTKQLSTHHETMKFVFVYNTQQTIETKQQ